MTRRVYERRACTILYNLLQSSPAGPWLLPANACPVLPLTFRLAGRPFELLDIDPDDLCLDRGAVVERLKHGNYAGLLFVRTYGTERSFAPFFETVKRRSPQTLVVDDRCLCAPELQAVPTGGGPADVVLFSTGYAKPVDIGGGGFAVLGPDVPYARHPRPHDPDELPRVEAAYKSAIATRSPYTRRDGDWLPTAPPEPDWEAYAARVAAALAPARRLRSAINAIYAAAIPETFCLPPEFRDWRFQIVVPHKQRLLDAIFAAGLFAGDHYASLTGVFGPGSSPVADDLHDRVVNLFNDRYYSEEQARRTAVIVQEHLDRHV